jgi:hypothetical protein
MVEKAVFGDTGGCNNLVNLGALKPLREDGRFSDIHDFLSGILSLRHP